MRRFADAANAGIQRAIKAGCKKIVLMVPDIYQEMYPSSVLVTWLGGMHALFTPLEIRRDVPGRANKIEALGLWSKHQSAGEDLLKLANAIELGRVAARDIGGSDPETMAPQNVWKYVECLFPDTVTRSVETGHDYFKTNFPLLAAVDRAANRVERHRAHLITLTYNPSDQVTQTLFLVGKGITYDTGGTDIKAGGVMAAMHRDKCGAAAVAGFLKTVAMLKPKGLKVVGQMAMVRNSVGEESYVADELITTRAGVRVRIGNTDAEGRNVMSDPLCRAKEWALEAVNPHIMTVATLTGHVIRAFGPAYTGVMDNGPAKQANFARDIQQAGDLFGDVFEISTIRREDYDFVVGKSEYEDVLQCNNAPSTGTARGHQFPAAFMIRASKLNEHGRDSKNPLRYSHMDVAGSSGPFPGIPTGAPIPSLTKYFVVGKY